MNCSLFSAPSKFLWNPRENIQEKISEIEAYLIPRWESKFFVISSTARQNEPDPLCESEGGKLITLEFARASLRF